MEPNHTVLNSDAVHEGFLVIKEVGVRDPQLVCYSVVQRQVEGDPGIGQSLVSPVLLEVHGQRVVLRGARQQRHTCTRGRSLAFVPLTNVLNK